MVVLTDKKTHVWLLKIDSMGGGNDFHETAYIDRYVAERAAEDLKEEWTSFDPKEFLGEEITKDRVIVKNIVYKLDKNGDDADLKERTLKRLSPEEQKVLGLIK